MKLKTLSLLPVLIISASPLFSHAASVHTFAASTAASTEYSETQNGDIIDKKSGFEYNILDDGTIELRAYTGSAQELVIPETLNGRKVTSLAFFGGMLLESHLSTCVKSIIIPDTVTRLGNSAFKDCHLLENITIPDSVTQIGSYAFSGCSRLKSITLPEGITEIGDDFFQGLSLIHI